MNAAELIRETRRRHGITQRSLAVRAGTGQAAVSRIERGEVSPSIDTVERLLGAMGERGRLASEPFRRDHDPVHLSAGLRRSPSERLELAIGWNRLAADLAMAGRRTRGE